MESPEDDSAISNEMPCRFDANVRGTCFSIVGGGGGVAVASSGTCAADGVVVICISSRVRVAIVEV